MAWWQAESNFLDSVGTNNGSPTSSVTFTNGEVGRGFVFNGSTYIPVAASPSLNIGTNANGLTIECWIMPNAANVSGSGGPIVEWDSSSAIGLQFWSYGELFANLLDTSGNAHGIQTSTKVLVTNQWQHVAITYNKSTGLAALYLNGVVVVSNNFGNITPQTSLSCL